MINGVKKKGEDGLRSLRIWQEMRIRHMGAEKKENGMNRVREIEQLRELNPA